MKKINLVMGMEAMKKNIIISGADMSSSAHIDYYGKYVLILYEGINTRIRW